MTRPQAHRIREQPLVTYAPIQIIARSSSHFVPIFFVSVGMKVQPGMLNPFAEHAQFGIAMLLTAVAVASKLAAGLAVYQKAVRRRVVGVGMVPRGEVGLIFAGAGLSAGVITQDLYSALVVVVILTTFAAPPGLKALYREKKARRRPE
jgi:Kef-type K+ transport system membrane component KefB